jgi:REP element-mobilizing transposase RayT
MATLKQEHSAYATLLSIGNTPWTYSDQLTENQAHGIVRLLSEHDEGLRSKKALIRYIRLSGTGNDFLLYATPVIGDINLSMIFGMDTPFSVARRQTLRISRLLVEQDPRKTPQVEEKPIIEKLVSVSQTDDEPLRPSDWLPGPKISPKESEPSVTHTSPTVAEEPEGEKVITPSITTAPEVASLPNDWLPKEPKPTSHLPFLEQEAPQPKKVVELEPINLVQQEPKYYLPFTAILLPRFPHHRLTGSLADQLENWLKDLCIAWGWRVDHVDLRSELLRFTISLSPDVAPAQAVQNLANNLSGKILNAFPNLKDDLPSGQFWTKSYLLTAGSDVGKDRLALFIETTRKEQGLVN